MQTYSFIRQKKMDTYDYIENINKNVAPKETPMGIVNGGLQEILYDVVQAGNQTSTTGAQYSFTIPAGCGLSRTLIKHVVGTVTFSSGVNAQDLNANTRPNIYFRPYPLHTAISNITLTSGSAQLSTPQPNQWVSNILPMIDTKTITQRTFQSGTPVYYDTLANPVAYTNLSSSPASGQDSVVRGDGVAGTGTANFISRVYTAQTAGNPATLVYTFEIYEPLMVPVLSTLGDDDEALFGINSININITYQNMLQRMFNTNTLTSVLGGGDTATLALSTQEIQYKIFTPSERVSILRPIKQHYQCNTFELITQTGAVPAAGNPATNAIRTNQMATNIVPKYVIIWATPQSSTTYSRQFGIGYNDFLFPISNIVLNINGKGQLLATASPHQLYLMSVIAGLKRDFKSFSGTPYYTPNYSAQVAAPNSAPSSIPNGCPIIVDIDQLGIEGVVSGLVAPFWLQVNQAYIQNPFVAVAGFEGAAVPAVPAGACDFNLLFVYPSVVTVESGTLTLQQGYLSKQDVTTAQEKTYRGEHLVLGSDHGEDSLMGGSFGSWFMRTIGNPIASGAKSAWNYAKDNAVPLLKKGAKFALAKGADLLAEAQPELAPFVEMGSSALQNAIGSGRMTQRQMIRHRQGYA